MWRVDGGMKKRARERAECVALFLYFVRPLSLPPLLTPLTSGPWSHRSSRWQTGGPGRAGWCAWLVRHHRPAAHCRRWQPGRAGRRRPGPSQARRVRRGAHGRQAGMGGAMPRGRRGGREGREKEMGGQTIERNNMSASVRVFFPTVERGRILPRLLPSPFGTHALDLEGDTSALGPARAHSHRCLARGELPSFPHAVGQRRFFLTHAPPHALPARAHHHV